MNGIINGKLVSQTVKEVITKNSVILSSGYVTGTQFECYQTIMPSQYYFLCCSQGGARLIQSDSPMVCALYYVDKTTKQITTVWYESNKDYSVSSTNPSRYTFNVDASSGRITGYWYSDSGRSGTNEFSFFAFS